MASADWFSDEKLEELNELEKRCEDLIAVAMEEGTQARYLHVRYLMNRGRKYGIALDFVIVQAHLEQQIANARRERLRRASRRPFVIRIKNLIGL